METTVQKIKKQRGVSLLLALMMVTLIVFLVVFVSAISTGQLKLSGSAVDSSRAFSAADAGIEYALSRVNSGLAVGQDAASCSCDSGTWCPGTQFSSSSVYCVIADNPASPRKITAIGRTTDTNIRRSLEILVPAYAAVGSFATICAIGNGTPISLNALCQAAIAPGGGGFTGSTGMVSAGGPNCTTTYSPTAGQISLYRTIDGGGANTNILYSSGVSYVIQCYK